MCWKIFLVMRKKVAEKRIVCIFRAANKMSLLKVDKMMGNKSWLMLLCSAFISMKVSSQEIPLVYGVENTVPDASPVLPGFDELPAVEPLPDPFLWSDGSGYCTDFRDWSRRRAEIGKEIEHYEIGSKPTVDRRCIQAEMAGDTLFVRVTVGGETLCLSAGIVYPEGEGPFPAIIGIGRGSGSLPPEIFSKRGIAQIAFDFTQVMSHTQKRGEEPINRLYPEQTDMGAYAA